LDDKKYIKETFDLENLILKKSITCPEMIFPFASKEPMGVCAVCSIKSCDLYWLDKYLNK